jgi:hypothetical protein
MHVKPFRLSNYAQGYAGKRGFTAAEVEDAIRTAPWKPADQGRLQCAKRMRYNQEWNGRVYATKRVQPVFVEADDEIVVVTV